MHMTMLLCSFFVLAFAANAQSSLEVTVKESIATLKNLHPLKSIVGFHLESNEGIGKNSDLPFLLKPGQSGQMPAEADNYHVDGVLLDDGTVEGANRWGIERHVKLWREVMSGGPAYPDALDYAASGASMTYALIWARRLKLTKHIEAKIVSPSDGAHPEVVSTIIQSTFQVQGWQDGELTEGGRGAIVSCSEFETVLGSDSPTPSVQCTGYAQCTLPLTIPGKSHVYVSGFAWSQCPLAVINADSELNDSSPPPYPGTMTAAYADAAVNYVGGTALTGYQIDSCSLPFYSSGPIVSQFCPN